MATDLYSQATKLAAKQVAVERNAVSPSRTLSSFDYCCAQMPNKRKKPIGLVDRNATRSAATSDKRKAKKSKAASHTADNHPTVPKQSNHEEPQHVYWNCQSEIDRQAAACVGKLLAADASKRGGTSIKALTLAPHIKAKKAVYAVTCQTLQCE